jgi:hypothetical protein
MTAPSLRLRFLPAWQTIQREVNEGTDLIEINSLAPATKVGCRLAT